MIIRLFIGVVIFDGVYSILHAMSDITIQSKLPETHRSGTLHTSYYFSSGVGDFGSCPANGLIFDSISFLWRRFVNGEGTIVF